VLAGEVFDVAVDVRVGSPNFGKWTGAILSADDHRQLWIPPGFAHGFCVTSESALFAYKCTAPYSVNDELGLRVERSRHRHSLAGGRAQAFRQGQSSAALPGRHRSQPAAALPRLMP
jgi:hypothetical protein